MSLVESRLAPREAPAEASLASALEALAFHRQADGTYQGSLEVGVLGNVATIVVRRFSEARFGREAEQLELELARYLLGEQLPSGQFRAYPDGPPSREATKLAQLGLRRVLASNTLLAQPLHARDCARCASALEAAERALGREGEKPRDAVSLRGFRMLLEVIDANGPGSPPRVLPDVGTLAPPLKLVAWSLTAPFAGAVERAIYPFITELGPLLELMLGGIRRRSALGVTFDALIHRTPRLEKWLEEDARLALLEHVLARQEATGAYFFSTMYTEFFVAAVAGELSHISSTPLRERAERALHDARAYLSRSVVEASSGAYVRFLESDVWDTAGVGMAVLMGNAPALPPAQLAHLARFVLAHQTRDGGWSFSRESPMTDCDSTGFVLTFLGSLRAHRCCPELDLELDAAIARAVDLLETWQADDGGFGAWGKSSLEKRRGPVGELASIALDVPTEDVTGRVLMGLGMVRKAARADPAMPMRLGSRRLESLHAIASRAHAFLLRMRDPRTGLWPARWTLGYLSGTAFVLAGLAENPFAIDSLCRDALATVLAAQNPDGGFGESPDSDRFGNFVASPVSTVLQTFFAMDIMRTCGLRHDAPAYQDALAFVLRKQSAHGLWPSESVSTCFHGLYYRYNIMTHCAGIAALVREVNAG
ncbi:MAG: hypothetical protein JST54_06415 [Deltaproteobacteria bacterium]|nr:hypothetical protein [Deltaproteobacteria bacterium]